MLLTNNLISTIGTKIEVLGFSSIIPWWSSLSDVQRVSSRYLLFALSLHADLSFIYLLSFSALSQLEFKSYLDLSFPPTLLLGQTSGLLIPYPYPST
jgi:hypothetical protein